MATPVKIHRRQKKTAEIIGQRGEIAAWTIVRVAAKLFANQAPYPVVIVKFSTDERVMGQLVDWEEGDLRVGREVVGVLRRAVVEDGDGVISYTVKFRPL
jgi:uncharacterized OB-fold protein